MFVYINSTDRTEDVIRKSLSIEDDIREKPNGAFFRLKGDRPSYFQTILIYAGYEIDSATTDSVTLDVDYRENENNLFRIGDTIYVAINESDEESATISSIANNSGKIKLTVSANFSNTPASGERCGKKMFGGSIVDVDDRNPRLLTDIEFSISAIDFTRIFDKRLINDTYSDKDSRYIINDFCNVTVNYNQVVDAMNYAEDADIQTEWVETGDGDNPATDTSEYREGTASGILPWTNSGGTATFTASPASMNISEFTGVNSGAPTKGVLGFWYKCTNFNDITSFDVRIGSDSSNYTAMTVTPDSNDWIFADFKLKDASITGTPDWTATAYLAVVVTETGNDSIRFDGFRILEEEFFKHYPYVQASATFDEFRVDRVKPTETMQRMADELGWFWYIDYDRYIRLFSQTTNNAPFGIDEESDNFSSLSIDYNTSRLVNRQIVKGGDETSENTYSQVFEGDGITREWILKNKFKNLVLSRDDNTVTDLMEVGTTTTNVAATAHGLANGDYIVNRTQGNEVRQITLVDDDNFTVEAVTGQGNGDTFSKFTEVNVGVEGLDEEVGNNFMSNFNEKSIRNSEEEDTILAGTFLLAVYNEVFPILVQRSENISITNMKNILGHTDGIFDGQPIINKTIKSRTEASLLADATLNKYANVIITADFQTWENGLKAGQLINIKDTDNGTRNIDQNFVIQKVRIQEFEWGHFSYSITCSSLLFGMLELLIQILKQGRTLDVDEDAKIANVEEVDELIILSDSASSEVSPNKQEEEITISDSITEQEVFEPPFKWGVDPDQGRWNLCSWY